MKREVPSREAGLEKQVLPFSERGPIRIASETYGQSVSGISLEYWPSKTGKTEILIVAGIHGEESESTVLLSRALRTFKEPSEYCSLVLAANPDGLLRGTRGNLNNVDLNRNFPTANWEEGEMEHYWSRDIKESVMLNSGTAPGSEPETKALLSLVERLKPRYIIALHSCLGWIDDPLATELGKWLSKRTEMDLVADPGYPTPGSFGTWCAEQNLPIVTYELPLKTPWEMLDTHLAVLQELLLRGKRAWE